MLEQVREAEIAQAVDRVRPVFNRRRIFILTSLALDVTVDKAMPWPELRPGKFAFAFAQHGVLPVNAGDLAKAFPYLWKDQKAAEDALRWCRAKLPGGSQIDILFGVLRVVFGELLKAAYRRKNQRGPAARALVRADLDEPRAVLEGLIGEVVEFLVERPPDPAQDTAPAPDLPAETSAPIRPKALPPLAAALSAEGHLLASLPSDARPPDMLGMAGVMKLMALAAEAVGTERAAVA